ncbi:hypothetical protein AHYW_004378 (plasmid) [Providencia manganoxydans]
MNMRMLIELATVGVEGAKDTDFEPKPSGVFEHSTRCTAKELVEQGPIIVEVRPTQVRHRESDVLPFAIRLDMPLLCNPLFGTFETTGTAGFRFTGLAKEAIMGAIRRRAAITTNAHRTGATGEHLFNTEELPFIDVIIFDEAIPSVIVLK